MPLPVKPQSLEPENQPQQNTLDEEGLPIGKINQPVAQPKNKIMEIGEGLEDITIKAQEDEENPNYVPKFTRITIGQLTSEDILTKSYEKTLAPFQDKIIEVTDWAREVYSERGQDDLLSQARRNRGKDYEDQAAKIDNLLVKYFSEQNVVRSKDAPIIIAAVINELLGLGPIEPLWQDPRISEIMVNGPYDVKVEIEGKVRDAPGAQFRDAKHLLDVCQQILGDIGREVNIQRPTADGRLPDQSRINVVHNVIAPEGPFLTIRRFPDTVFTIKELVERESMTEEIAVEIGNLIYKGCSVIIAGGTGSGKQVSHDTLIPTPSGMTTMGELQVGDLVLDENGEATRVTAKYSNKVPVAYEMTFSDGTKVIADEDHNWFTSTRQSRRAISRQENETKIINTTRESFATDLEKAELTRLYFSKAGELVSTSEIIKNVPNLRNMVNNTASKLTAVEKRGRSFFYNASELIPLLIAKADTFKNDQRNKMATENVYTTKEILETLRTSSGHANHAVKVISKPVAYSLKKLTIEPYTLGAWLGDGYSNTGKICGIDDEIFANVISEGYIQDTVTYDKRDGKHENLKAVRFDGLTQALKTLGVLNNKHIPQDYLYSSIEQREALIAGLLDTDGTVNKNGTVQFTNTNKDIITGFRQILHSLGYQTTLTTKIPSYEYLGEKREGKLSYTVSFYPKKDVFRISRKSEKLVSNMRVSQGHRQEYRYIVDIQPVESVPMSCITVDNANHLYLVSDAFITTHNTSALNALSGAIPFDERVITIEDNLELRLNPTKHVLAMEAKQAAASGEGSITIRDLVKNSLRMRPDRIVVGEVRDEAAYDMLQAMNTGHDGSLTTVHANDPEGTIDRLVNLISQVGDFAPERALSLIAGGVDAIVIVERYEDGSRRISNISEVPTVIQHDGRMSKLEPRTLWEFRQTGTERVTDSDGNEKEIIVGEYVRVNELSEATIRKHRLDKKRDLTLEELYKISDIPK